MRPLSIVFVVVAFVAGLGVLGGATLAQERPLPQARGGQVTPPRIAAPRVPVVSVPEIAAPRTGVPQPRVPAAQQLRLTAARAEAFADAARLGLDHLPGEALVKFKPGMDPSAQQRALSTLSGQPSVGDLEWRGEVAIVRDGTQQDAWAMARQLAAQPEVEYAEPNFIARIDPIVRDAARPSTSVTGVRAPRGRVSSMRARVDLVPTDGDYQAFQWNFALLNMPGAWNIQPGGSSDLIVAIIDTGITAAAQTQTFPLWTGSGFQNIQMPFAINPDLPATRLVAPRDFAFLDPNGPVVDMDGHGTHVSGTVGQATNNGLLVAGMAYNVRIMPVKVCVGYWEVMIGRAQGGIPGFAPSDSGGCSFADIADGIRYAADNGARVLNISLGGTSQSTTLLGALQYAVSRGAFISVSMGNRFEQGNATSYPAGYAPGLKGLMSVGATGKTLAKAYYSSTGTHAEIAAPGGDSRVGAGTLDQGRIWQSTLLAGDISPFITIPRFDRYDKDGYQGTSMASPHVAGLAALLLSQVPSLTPAQLEAIIRATARDIGLVGEDDAFGDGLIQPRTALFGRGIR